MINERVSVLKEFISIPVIESGLYVFGGHMHTVPGGWKFFEQKHQIFELMCILSGHQITKIKGGASFTYGPGDVMIISPGTVHINQNESSTESMTYICFHFNFESLQLKSKIICEIANRVISSETDLAKMSVKTATDIINCCQDHTIGSSGRNIKIQIILLEFLYQLTEQLQNLTLKRETRFTEREAKVSQEIVALIEHGVDNLEVKSFKFGDVCHQLGISNGYGYRTFKKVYGVTPLHFMNEQRYRKAKILLGYLEYSIEDVANILGSSNISIFSKQFKKWSGMTPSAYRQQNKKRRRVKSVNQSGYFE